MNSADNYHVHVYFNASTKPTAEVVVAQLAEKFGLQAGTFHDKAVGPHPVGSCQVHVSLDLLGPVTNWLTHNRQSLTILVHADTGDVLKDHTEHTFWFGSMPELNMEFLEKFVAERRG